MTPRRIIFHHSDAQAPSPQFAAIDQWHKERKFPLSSMGFYVGYHYVIEKDGTVRQARKEDEIGAHDEGENVNSIGICLVGNFTYSLPTEQQAAAAATLVGQIRSRWPIPVTRIEPHRWDDTTECPGKMLPDNWLTVQYLDREAGIFFKYFLLVGQKFGLL